MSANEPVKLRKRKTRTGLYSLYLDTYTNGRRTYEYLRLYLVPERTREDKRKNKETLQLAETCLLYTSPSPRDISGSRMPSSA